MNYAGIDASLTATGLSLVAPDGSILEHRTISPPDKVVGVPRLDFFANFIKSWVAEREIAIYGIEGYSFGSVSRAHSIGELGGIIKLEMYRANVRGMVCPPQTLKKFTTGSGAGGVKGIMIREVFRRYGAEVNDDNEADAVALAQMARMIDANNDVPLTAYQIECVPKVQWLPRKKVRMR